MNLIVIMVGAFILVLYAYARTPRNTSTNIIEVLPATKVVEVEIIDEMTKEKVRNLYEEQDVYNAKISHLMKQNKQYEYEISLLDARIQKNLDDIRMQIQMQPNMDMNVMKASYEDSNRNIYKHRLKLEGMILTNAERIVAYKKKSNAISEQITKIGKEVYSRQMR